MKTSADVTAVGLSRCRQNGKQVQNVSKSWHMICRNMCCGMVYIYITYWPITISPFSVLPNLKWLITITLVIWGLTWIAYSLCVLPMSVLSLNFKQLYLKPWRPKTEKETESPLTQGTDWSSFMGLNGLFRQAPVWKQSFTSLKGAFGKPNTTLWVTV